MKKQEWDRILLEQEQSGKTATEFCRLRGINAKSLSYEKWKRRQQEGRELREPREERRQGTFVQVHGAAELRVEVVLVSGVVLRVPVSLLKAVLLEVVERC